MKKEVSETDRKKIREWIDSKELDKCSEGFDGNPECKAMNDYKIELFPYTHSTNKMSEVVFAIICETCGNQRLARFEQVGINPEKYL